VTVRGGVLMVDDVIEFPKVKVFSEEEALAYLRREGPIEGIDAFGKLVGWEKTRASRTVKKWHGVGKVVCTPRSGYATVVKAVVPAVQGVRPPVQPPLPPAAEPDARPPACPPARVAQPGARPAEADARPAHPATSHDVPAWCRWGFGILFVLLSLALYGASLFLNATFWPGLAQTEIAKVILAVVGVIIETVNFTIPSAVSIASMSRAFKRVVWVSWILTMTTAAVAGASFVRSNLGAAEVSRNKTIKERARLEYVISKAIEPVSDAAVVDARNRIETAKANRKTDCPRNRSLDIEVCNRSRAALGQAEADLKHANENHNADVKSAENRYRADIEKAKAEFEKLPVISADKNVVLAGVAAILPWLSEAWVNGIVAGLWVALFSFGPCMLLRLGQALLTPTK
jgi:hypothetical protein